MDHIQYLNELEELVQSLKPPRYTYEALRLYAANMGYTQETVDKMSDRQALEAVAEVLHNSGFKVKEVKG